MNVIDISSGLVGPRFTLERGVIIDHSPLPLCSKRVRFVGLAACHYGIRFQADYIVHYIHGPIPGTDHAVDVPGELLGIAVQDAEGVQVGQWEASDTIRWVLEDQKKRFR